MHQFVVAGAGSPVQRGQAGGEAVHTLAGRDGTAALQERHQQGVCMVTSPCQASVVMVCEV